MTLHHLNGSAGFPGSLRARRFLRRTSLVPALLLLGGFGAQANSVLFDFGADATQTVGGSAGPTVIWNNVTTAVGNDDFGSLPNLVLTDGTPTDVSILMVSRFNGANESGTAASALYPGPATRDSLFGNTESFSGLENITPVFKLSGLNSASTYSLTFFASRLGVTDVRETRYTVTGGSETFVDLDAGNNVTNTVKVASVVPDGAGEITIALTPGPNNNNANHFVYLGVLGVEVSGGGKMLVDFGAAGSPTDVVEPPAATSWNNVTATIGSSPSGSLTGLVTTNGTVTPMALQMVSRFNGANTAGSTAAKVFPTTATQDSLFGNTEAFGGLSNVLPEFKVTGLDAGYAYSFTFYGSRTGAADNRETRYTVTGANAGFADLNTANNVDATVSVANIRPTAAGEIAIGLSPGPNNNNANHFTYLGAVQMDFTPVRTPRLLLDFGAAGTPTSLGNGDTDNQWNNITPAVGGTDDGSVAGLVKTDGAATSIGFQMVSRFNGANENGINPPGLYVATATRDSLFGNTEPFSGLENVTPIFKLTGLSPATAYELTFFASRMGVGDNRETRFTVNGAAEATADLNAANNEAETVSLTGVKPNAAGEITVALAPGPNNDNGNHFVYLGVLQVDWEAPAVTKPAALSAPVYADGRFTLTVTGSAGATYTIQRTRNFTGWETAQTVTLGGTAQTIEIPQAEAEYFYRAVSP